MSNDQIRRANRIVYPVIMVIMGYVLFTLLAFILYLGEQERMPRLLFRLWW